MTLQLLAQVSHDDQLDSPKYKCAVSLEFICNISRWARPPEPPHTWLMLTEPVKGTDLCARFHVFDLFSRTVNFDIMKYLYDFLWGGGSGGVRAIGDRITKSAFFLYCKDSCEDQQPSQQWGTLLFVLLPPCGWCGCLLLIPKIIINICISAK